MAFKSKRLLINQGTRQSKFIEDTKLPSSSGKPVMRTAKRLSAAEMDEKRARGLCFWCDEKFTPGHNCRGRKQLYFLEVEEEEEEWELNDGLSEEGAIDESALSPQMSVHALDGDYRTMRVKGGIKGKMVHVLILISYCHG